MDHGLPVPTLYQGGHAICTCKFTIGSWIWYVYSLKTDFSSKVRDYCCVEKLNVGLNIEFLKPAQNFKISFQNNLPFQNFKFMNY